MAESVIEVEAETLEEAREKLKSLIPEGLSLLSELVISDEKPHTVKVLANTIEKAFTAADIPRNATITEKEELSIPEHRKIMVEAFDEQHAKAKYFGRKQDGNL